MKPESTDPSQHALCLRLFGSFEFLREGKPVTDLSAKKDQWLLALLALAAGQPVLRTTLAQTLWPFPETLESRATLNLRRSLVAVRKALGSLADRLQAPTYQTLRLVLAEHEADVLAFDKAVAKGDRASLEQALNLYRGPLLAGCTDAWVLVEREQHQQAYQKALQQLGAFALAGGDNDTAVGYYQQAIAVDPYWEVARRGLMEALARRGDGSAALQVYQDLLRLLQKQDPRATPGEETTDLYRRIRAELKDGADKVKIALVESASSESTDTLPHPVTELVGREDEIVEVAARLRLSRLVTLTGAGGVGKTRLALAVAEHIAPDYTDGVCFVALDALSEERLVVQQIASSLGIREKPGRSLLQSLTTSLCKKRLLMLLDNCEHLLVACAQVVRHLLQECGGIRILATSRQALGITGETAWQVPSLSVPDPAHLPGGRAKRLRVLMSYEGVQLFVAHAEAVQKTFTVTGENALDVAQVCWQLDGVPLALELAAAQIKEMPVEQIAQRLGERLQMLVGSSHTALPRHQTLRATMDWSYDLLSQQERALLNRLSVFAGGWTLEAAEAVCAGEEIEDWRVLKLLTSLVDKSLVVFEDGEKTGARYRQLETVRQYAAHRLHASGEDERVRARHLHWYLSLAESVGGSEIEHDNFRVALDWCREGGEAESGLRLASALWNFWRIVGHWKEGRHRLAEALSRPDAQDPTAARAQALTAVGVLAYWQADYEAARSLQEQGLVIWRQLEDSLGIAKSLANFAIVSLDQGDYAAAQELFQQCLSIARNIGDIYLIIHTLHNLAHLALLWGDYTKAHARTVESMAVRNTIAKERNPLDLYILAEVALAQGDYALAWALGEECLAARRDEPARAAEILITLGKVAEYQGDYRRALRYYTESLTIFQKIRSNQFFAVLLRRFAAIALAQDQSEQAACLWGAEEALREAIHSALPPAEREQYDRLVTAAQETLGEEVFATAWEQGRMMTMEQAIEYALETSE